MRARRRPAQRRATQIGNNDLCDGFTPIPGRSWVEAALAGPGAIVSDIAKSVADAAVFAAMEAIAEQGVEGRPKCWEIDAVHRLITDIVILRLSDSNNRGRIAAVANLIADPSDGGHESGGECITQAMLMYGEAPA